jgi:hypothetical protein
MVYASTSPTVTHKAPCIGTCRHPGRGRSFGSGSPVSASAPWPEGPPSIPLASPRRRGAFGTWTVSASRVSWCDVPAPTAWALRASSLGVLPHPGSSVRGGAPKSASSPNPSRLTPILLSARWPEVAPSNPCAAPHTGGVGVRHFGQSKLAEWGGCNVPVHIGVRYEAIFSNGGAHNDGPDLVVPIWD